MKKLIALTLALVMLFAVMTPAVSVSAANERTPIVYIRGNGDGLYYPDDTLCVAQFEDLSLGGEEGIDKDKIVETTVNILKPFVLEGMIFDKCIRSRIPRSIAARFECCAQTPGRKARCIRFPFD